MALIMSLSVQGSPVPAESLMPSEREAQREQCMDLVSVTGHKCSLTQIHLISSEPSQRESALHYPHKKTGTIRSSNGCWLWKCGLWVKGSIRTDLAKTQSPRSHGRQSPRLSCFWATLGLETFPWSGWWKLVFPSSRQ